MKKFIRYLRLRRQSPSDRDEHMKRVQRYEADFTLEPFAGLTPEYMEMSEHGPGLRGRRVGTRSWRAHAAGLSHTRDGLVTCTEVARNSQGRSKGPMGRGQVQPQGNHVEPP